MRVLPYLRFNFANDEGEKTNLAAYQPERAAQEPNE
jgi:hypothetical protein